VHHVLCLLPLTNDAQSNAQKVTAFLLVEALQRAALATGAAAQGLLVIESCASVGRGCHGAHLASEVGGQWRRKTCRPGFAVRYEHDRGRPGMHGLGGRDQDHDGIRSSRNRDRDADGVRNSRDRSPDNPYRR
jgi:hypothetical protein